jgi:hypothetical protein
VKFEISRTNGSRLAPCKGAKLDSVDEWGNRTYTIEVGTLNELIVLVREYGPIIIAEGYEPGNKDADPLTLEIYDGYRE